MFDHGREADEGGGPEPVPGLRAPGGRLLGAGVAQGLRPDTFSTPRSPVRSGGSEVAGPVRSESGPGRAGGGQNFASLRRRPGVIAVWDRQRSFLSEPLGGEARSRSCGRCGRPSWGAATGRGGASATITRQGRIAWKGVADPASLSACFPETPGHRWLACRVVVVFPATHRRPTPAGPRQAALSPALSRRPSPGGALPATHARRPSPADPRPPSVSRRPDSPRPRAPQYTARRVARPGPLEDHGQRRARMRREIEQR